jgi:hypothetical protein
VGNAGGYKEVYEGPDQNRDSMGLRNGSAQRLCKTKLLLLLLFWLYQNNKQMSTMDFRQVTYICMDLTSPLRRFFKGNTRICISMGSKFRDYVKRVVIEGKSVFFQVYKFVHSRLCATYNFTHTIPRWVRIINLRTIYLFPMN